jgi:hypothetical protein
MLGFACILERNSPGKDLWFRKETKVMEADSVLRDQLLALLRGGNAYMPFDPTIADFPDAYMNTCPPNVPYTPWHLLEHIRRAQRDILDFIRNPHYVSPEWPKDFWPAPDDHADRARWDETVRSFHQDLTDLEALVQDPNSALTDPLPHAAGYTLFREVLLVTDHNAFHLGEFAILRQVMGTWPPAHIG